MPIHWREQDWDHLREAVRDESGIQGPLASCGMLKFFDYPLIRSQEYLLQCVISLWSTDMKCFIVQGKQMTFSAMEDVYFLMGLPFWGMALPVDPQLPRDVHLVDVARRYCSRPNTMLGSVILIKVMDALLHQCIAAMIVRIYESLATHWISGSQQRIM
jgi:hypothetical protein